MSGTLTQLALVGCASCARMTAHERQAVSPDLPLAAHERTDAWTCCDCGHMLAPGAEAEAIPSAGNGAPLQFASSGL